MILDLFSKRQQKFRKEVPDVYQYTILPEALRVQIVYIIREAYGLDEQYSSGPRNLEAIHDALAREYGVFQLGKPNQDRHWALIDFFLQTGSLERALDVVELAFRVLKNRTGDQKYAFCQTITTDDAIVELNNRFKEHGVGYQFEVEEIVKVDSQMIHAEVVRPLLAQLSTKEFVHVLEEFTSAHTHYRHGRHKECLNDCLKAFESCLKVTCKLRGWNFNKTDTAKPLLDTLFANSYFPSYMQSQLSALRSLLESGVPTIRNKNSAHGQGAEAIEVRPELASYTLHLTATTLLFIRSLA